MFTAPASSSYIICSYQDCVLLWGWSCPALCLWYLIQSKNTILAEWVNDNPYKCIKQTIAETYSTTYIAPSTCQAPNQYIPIESSQWMSFSQFHRWEVEAQWGHLPIVTDRANRWKSWVSCHRCLGHFLFWGKSLGLELVSAHFIRTWPDFTIWGWEALFFFTLEKALRGQAERWHNRANFDLSDGGGLMLERTKRRSLPQDLTILSQQGTQKKP